jgi:hypothetical protein
LWIGHLILTDEDELEVTYSISSFSPSFGNKKDRSLFLLFNKVLISSYCEWSIRSHMVQKTSL